MKKTILIFSVLILCILGLFQLSQMTFFNGDPVFELVIAMIAVAFFFVGIWFNQKHKKSKTPGIINYHTIKSLRISAREYEVLQAMAEEKTNKEIAEKLFVSESTVKSHVSNVLSKLEVEKRHQAVKKAHQLHLI